MKRGAVLEAACDMVSGEREAVYGTPQRNFGRIASFWSTYLDREVTATDVAAMMVLVKIARLINTPDHSDSWVDAAGYAALGSELSDDGNNSEEAVRVRSSDPEAGAGGRGPGAPGSAEPAA